MFSTLDNQIKFQNKDFASRVVNIYPSELKHVEFSDEEKGFLTKEQMDTISQKIGDAKKFLTEFERDGKSKGKLLKNHILDNEE